VAFLGQALSRILHELEGMTIAQCQWIVDRTTGDDDHARGRPSDAGLSHFLGAIALTAAFVATGTTAADAFG